MEYFIGFIFFYGFMEHIASPYLMLRIAEVNAYQSLANRESADE